MKTFRQSEETRDGTDSLSKKFLAIPSTEASFTTKGKSTMEYTNQLSNKFLAYVRVSSKDQSRGTSLVEQKDYIQRYADNKKFIVRKFFGEVESASKAGREK